MNHGRGRRRDVIGFPMTNHGDSINCSRIRMNAQGQQPGHHVMRYRGFEGNNSRPASKRMFLHRTRGTTKKSIGGLVSHSLRLAEENFLVGGATGLQYTRRSADGTLNTLAAGFFLLAVVLQARRKERQCRNNTEQRNTEVREITVLDGRHNQRCGKHHG